MKGLREDRDCLKHFRRRVTEAGLLEHAELDAVETDVAALIESAVAKAHEAAIPAPDALLTDVYVSY